MKQLRSHLDHTCNTGNANNTGSTGNTDHARHIQEYTLQCRAGLISGIGRIIPGFGHAVLRVPDPRVGALLSFAEDDSVLSTFMREYGNMGICCQGLCRTFRYMAMLLICSIVFILHISIAQYHTTILIITHLYLSTPKSTLNQP